MQIEAELKPEERREALEWARRLEEIKPKS
jgi:hypothetical protein